MATVRGERDIAIGNVVGSNTFNILAVLGASALVAPEPLAVAPSVLAFDLPVMTAVAIACFPVFFTGRQIARWEGGVFLVYYAAYTAYLVLVGAALREPAAALGDDALVRRAVDGDHARRRPAPRGARPGSQRAQGRPLTGSNLPPCSTRCCSFP